MTKKVRILISLVLVAVAFIAGLTVYAQSNKDRSAQADGTTTTRYTVDADGKIAPPAMDSTKAKGTAENPFFVLEIVPYEGMASIGYQIAGCEPINMKAAGYAKADLPAEAQLYSSVPTHTEFLWLTDTIPSYYPATVPTSTITQYGTMKYVTDGTGNYKVQDGCTPNYLAADPPEGYTGPLYKYVNDVLTEAADGTKIRLVQAGTLKFEPTATGTGGNYLWTPLDAQTCGTMEYADSSDYRQNYVETGEFKTYFDNVQCYKLEGIKTYIHKNNFLKYSVGLAYEFDTNGNRVPYTEGAGKPTLEQRIKDYKCVVYTVTPEDLNITKDGVLLNRALIDQADLVSISSYKNNTALAAYEKFLGYDNESFDSSGLLGELNHKNPSGATPITFADNPLDWAPALALYERATSDTDPLPIIWDTHTLGDDIKSPTKTVDLKIAGKVDGSVTGSQNNLQKLYLMLHVSSTALFESQFGDPATFPTTSYSQDFTVNGATVTKTFKTPKLTVYEGEDGQSYWSNQTLYPWNSGLLPSKTSLDDPTNTTMLDLLGIMNNGGGAMFHYASGDAQNMVRNGFHTFDGDTRLMDRFMDESLVENDNYGREVYDYFASIGVTSFVDGSGNSISKVTTADILYYLLNGSDSGPGARTNKDYKILELQPAATYKGGTTSGIVTNDAFWDAFIANYANTTGNVTVERMSSSEFIGKQVECIEEYDMIYLGVKTMANNWTMDFSGTDFIYAHTGPVIHLTQANTGKEAVNAMKGWFDPVNYDEEMYFPFSGNDLTTLAKQKLIDYVKEGSPVLFGTGFYTSVNATTIVDEIDRNSNVYDFAKNYVTTPIYEAAFNDASTRVAAENNLRHGLAGNHRVTLEVLAQPKLYDEDAASESAKYLSGDALTFKFKVHAPANTEYEVALYVDTNGDGVFTANERMSSVNLRKEGGGSVSKVLPGQTYTAQKIVEDRKGAVAWKLVLVHPDTYYATVTPVEERPVLACISGLSAIKASEKEPLRILQIEMTSGNTVQLPMDSEYPTGISLEDIPDPTVKDKFYAWTRDINGLDVSFIRMTEDAIKTELTGNSRYLKDNYEMIVLGVGDMYYGVQDADVLNAIDEFMKAGKAILYTHDASSMIGTDNDDSWGKALTEKFRDDYGMDRYDVKAHKSKTTLGSDEERADYPYMATVDEDDIGDLLLQDGQALTQGLTNGHIFRYQKLGYNNLSATRVAKVNEGAITQYPYKIGELNGEGVFVDDEISIAMTHPQYYQLDMENKDLTVWYCLAEYDKAASDLQWGNATEKAEDKTNIDLFYNYTSNDVRNNYYIYNYGNVTYSGMGHSADLSDAEIKLFINTFVAAYRAAGQGTQIVVTNEDATRNVTGGEYFIPVDVDSSDSDALLGGASMGAYESYRLQENVSDDVEDGYNEVATPVAGVAKRVEFYIQDNSSVNEPEFFPSFYLENADGDTTELIKLAVYRKSDNVFMDTKTDATKFKADSETIYYVDVPMKLETEGGKSAIASTKVRVQVDMTYLQGGEGSERIPAEPGNTTVNIIPRGLFDLD